MSSARLPRLRGLGLVSSGLLLTGCGNLNELGYEPAKTPEQWCDIQPCFEVAGATLAQPLGTILVFTLAILWLAGGGYFVHSRAGQAARSWFGLALVAGGLGAASAGVSFQTFGYELKCAGRQECLFTNGFEVGFSIAQAASVSLMLIAVAYACSHRPVRNWLISYSVLNLAVYVALSAVAVLAPNRFLLSFEVLMLFAVPGIIAVLVVAGIRYRADHDPRDRSVLWAAALLIVVQVAYFVYFSVGVTTSLWDGGNGFYFSENDVLHVGMILWLAYAVFVVGKYLRDVDTPREALSTKTSASDATSTG
jgi:hypothetical protein